MTDTLLQTLADIIERHQVPAIPVGTAGTLRDPSRVNWDGVIADLRREAARDGTGGGFFTGKLAHRDDSKIPYRVWLPDGHYIAGRRVGTEGDAIPGDVRRLIIAARKVAFGDHDQQDIKELDAASEAFADRVPWENEDE